jgi:hypothetical protein
VVSDVARGQIYLSNGEGLWIVQAKQQSQQADPSCVRKLELSSVTRQIAGAGRCISARRLPRSPFHSHRVKNQSLLLVKTRGILFLRMHFV